MGTSALGGFVEGLQGGITHRRETLRNKKIDRALDQQNKLGAMAIEGKQMDINRVRAEKGLGPRDFTQFEANQDPYGFKLGDFFKPRKLWQNFKDNTGFGSAAINTSSPAQANEAAIEDLTYGADASSIGVQGNTDNMFARNAANGGLVRRYADGGDVLTAEEQLERQRMARQSADARASVAERHKVGRERGNPDKIRPDKNREWTRRERMNRAGGSSSKKMGLDTAARRATGGGGRLARAGRGLGRAAAIATPTVMAGSAIKSGFTDTDEYRRRYEGLPALDFLKSEEDDWAITTAAKDLGYRTIGAFQDLGDTLLNPGRLFGDEDETPVAPERRAAIAASDVPTPEPEQAPTAAQRAETRPAPAPEAPQPPEVTGGPNQLADAPITDPGEMPTMNTEEWVAYRAASVESMLMQGMSLPEAHDAITGMQQKGFLNYGMQALQMLAAGDPARAAMALKAAYQYFPNGVDVKFGITKDKNGQPALVAMGTDEQTGEATGAPMLITGERLAVMMENMTDPSAFRTWTKDWREFEQELREYYEVDKQQAESENIYRDRMGRAALNRSEADLLGALGAGSGGLKQSDFDRAYAAMDKSLQDMGLFEKMPREHIEQLYAIAAIAYESNPGNYPATLREITSRYRAGGLEAVDQWIRSGE